MNYELEQQLASILAGDQTMNYEKAQIMVSIARKHESNAWSEYIHNPTKENKARRIATKAKLDEKLAVFWRLQGERSNAWMAARKAGLIP